MAADKEAETTLPSTAEPAQVIPAKDVPVTSAEPQVPTYAIVLSGGKLIKDYGNNVREPLADATGAKECKADPMHQVVWMIGPKGVATHDALDGRYRAVVPTDIKIDRFAVQAYVNPRAPYPHTAAGNFHESSDCVALVILVNADPTVSAGLVGEGVNCPSDMEEEILAREYQAVADHYNKIKSFDIKYLKELEIRRTKNWKEPEVSDADLGKAPVVAVDKSRCRAGAEDCGKATHVGGRIWSVVTANDLGDVHWEERQLFDATTREFLNPRDGTRSTSLLDPAPDLEGMQVSPDKAWVTYEGKRLSLTKGVLLDKLEGQFCGWGPL